MAFIMVACGGSSNSQNTGNQLDEAETVQIEKIEATLDSLKKEEEILDEINKEIEDLLSDLE